MIVYSDSIVSSQIIGQDGPNIITDFPRYLESLDPKKAVFHAPFPRHNDFDELGRNFDRAYDVSEQIILLVSELHNVTVDFIENYDKTKLNNFMLIYYLI